MARNVLQYIYHQYPEVSVLYVEDEKFSREKLLRVLNRRFATIHVAVDGIEGFQLFQQYQPDLVIIDISSNYACGINFIKKIRNFNESIQIIVTTAQEEQDCLIQSIENLANHIIAKPINLDQFLVAIHESIHHMKLIKELSMMDPLTNSFTRMKFNDILASEIMQTGRVTDYFSLIMLDIDNFTYVNDHFGRDSGDHVLVTISTIIQQRIRENDILARLDGGKFIMLTPETNSQGATDLAESIRTIIADFSFNKIGRLTCSFGITTFSPKKSPTTLIYEAEQALNQSKANGRNCVMIYNND